jgi:hypothetical protein
MTFFFSKYWSLNSGQATYHLNHIPIPFCSGCFGDTVLLYAQAGPDCDLPILQFLHTSGMTGAHHSA